MDGVINISSDEEGPPGLSRSLSSSGPPSGIAGSSGAPSGNDSNPGGSSSSSSEVAQLDVRGVVSPLQPRLEYNPEMVDAIHGFLKELLGEPNGGYAIEPSVLRVQVLGYIHEVRDRHDLSRLPVGVPRFRRGQASRDFRPTEAGWRVFDHFVSGLVDLPHGIAHRIGALREQARVWTRRLLRESRTRRRIGRPPPRGPLDPSDNEQSGTESAEEHHRRCW